MAKSCPGRRRERRLRTCLRCWNTGKPESPSTQSRIPAANYGELLSKKDQVNPSKNNNDIIAPGERCSATPPRRGDPPFYRGIGHPTLNLRVASFFNGLWTERTVNPVQTTAFSGPKKGFCGDVVDGGNSLCIWGGLRGVGQPDPLKPRSAWSLSLIHISE